NRASSPWNQHEGALRRFDPLFPHENRHRAFDDEEHVVVWMGVRAGAFRIGLEPPFRDGVTGFGLATVRLEHALDSAHLILAAAARLKRDGLPAAIRGLLR